MTNIVKGDSFSETDPKAWLELGMAFIQEDDLASAVECFSKGLVYAPFDSDMRFWRGRKLIGLAQYAQSAADLRLSALLDPENWEKWYYGGVAAYLAGMYEAAKESHEKARAMILKYNHLDHLPATTDWYWMICMKLGLKDEAAKALELIHPDMPAEDGDYLCRNLLYKGVLSPDGFVERCMESIANPDRPRVYHLMLTYGLANYLHFQGQDEKAIPLLVEVAESTDNRNLFAVKQAMMDLTEMGVPYAAPQDGARR